MKRSLGYFPAAALALLVLSAAFFLSACGGNAAADTADAGSESSDAETSDADSASDAQDAESGSDTQDTNSDEALSKYDAVAIVFDHAGVTINDVISLDSGKDSGADYAYYEIEFYTSDMKYDYEVDAATGEIVSITDRQTETASESEENEITLSSAMSIALEDAGVSTSDAAFAKALLREQDDESLLYEIEFEAAGIEYEYEIDAADGSVISRE